MTIEHRRPRVPGLIDPRAISGGLSGIASLYFMYDASNIIAADNDAIVAWNDVGPNSNHLSGTGTYKTNIINGQPAVLFGGSEYMASANGMSLITGSADRTIYCVYQRADTNARNVYGYGDTSGSQMWDLLTGYGGKALIHFHGPDSSSTAPGEPGSGVPALQYDKFESNVLTQDNNTGGSGTYGIGLSTGDTPIQVGRGQYATFNNFYGYIALLMGFSAAVNSDEHALALAYISGKYGLTL